MSKTLKTLKEHGVSITDLINLFKIFVDNYERLEDDHRSSKDESEQLELMKRMEKINEDRLLINALLKKVAYEVVEIERD